MKSIKIYIILIIIALFGNFVYANSTISDFFHKEKKFKTSLNLWETKKIMKYKHLAPLFPKEIPVEETITVYLKSVFQPNNSDNEVTNDFSYLAPVLPTEIPVEEQITVYSSTNNNTNIDNEEIINEYKHLAPVAPYEISIEE